MILSVGMIVKNESKYLKQCLEALQPILNNIDSELIIVDTGSTDNTVEIAKGFTDKVFSYEWNDNFAEARNITIDKAKGQWYFYIDADEILENTESIIEFFNSGKYKKYNGATIKIKNILIESDESTIADLFITRLVKLHKAMRFTGPIHEQLPLKEPIFISETYANHYGYENTDEELMEAKFTRNKAILEKVISDEPDNYYMLFQLAITYRMYKKYKEGEHYIEKAYDVAKKQRVYPMYIYNTLLKSYIQHNRLTEAEKIGKEVIKKKKSDTTAYIDTYIYLATIKAKQGKYEEAIENYEEYFKLVELEKQGKLLPDLTVTIYTNKSYYPMLLEASRLYDNIDNYDKALEYILKVLESEEDEVGSTKQHRLQQLINLWVKNEKHHEISNYYIEEFCKKEDENLERESSFIVPLETKLRENHEVKKELIKSFAKMDYHTDYIFLNKIRYKITNNKEIEDNEIDKIKRFNYKENINTYSELIYYLMKDGIDVNEILQECNDEDLQFLMSYILGTFKDFPEVIKNYFDKYSFNADINKVLYTKYLKSIYLIKSTDEDESYKKLFKSYIEDGIYYMDKLYKDEILDNENLRFMRNNEEVFLLYMRKAFIYQDTDLKQYISYLNKALKSYKEMNKGIEILKDELQDEVDNKKEEENFEKESQKQEFDSYKEIVKENISKLIDSGNIGEASLLIDEYLKIVPDDLEMLMLKSEAQLKLM